MGENMWVEFSADIANHRVTRCQARCDTLIVNLQQTMTSLEIAELTGKQHKNVIQAIRNMEPAWEKVNGLKFQLVEYRDAKVNFAPATNSPRRSVSTSHGARHAVT